jgi:hypothetical protein
MWGVIKGFYDRGGIPRLDLDALLGLLEGIQGKFLLSSFSNKSLKEFSDRNDWHTVEFKMASPMTHSRGRTVRGKVEVLTTNYPFKDKIKSRDRRRGHGKYDSKAFAHCVMANGLVLITLFS